LHQAITKSAGEPLRRADYHRVIRDVFTTLAACVVCFRILNDGAS